tara:strand:+ start:378 stop:689 length:312 start_codon:yes stop_codon:yes gene_type:complete
MKKDIVKIILETLSEDGFFNNEWIDENKFRPRFINSASKINFTDDLGKDMETLFNLAETVAKSIIQENVDTTMNDLIDKGLVEEVTNDKGETGFVLSKQLTNG